MALSVGMGVPVQYYCNNADQADSYWTDPEQASDSDFEEVVEFEEYAFTPSAFERLMPRSSKRTYGVFLDSDAALERRQRSRIHEQLALLRAVVPSSCTDQRESVLTGAYEYIESLQRQVQELACELDSESCWDDDESSCGDEESPVDFNVPSEPQAGCSGSPHSKVSVARVERGLKIHVDCENRPGLLVDMMELLESSGLSVEQANIICVPHFLMDCLGVEESDHVDRKSVSAENLGSSLRSLISNHRDAGSE